MQCKYRHACASLSEVMHVARPWPCGAGVRAPVDTESLRVRDASKRAKWLQLVPRDAMGDARNPSKHRGLSLASSGVWASALPLDSRKLCALQSNPWWSANRRNGVKGLGDWGWIVCCPPAVPWTGFSIGRHELKR